MKIIDLNHEVGPSLVTKILQKCASYHLPEDCTKREEYCCVKDERLSNYFHEIFFRLLLLLFCQVWHLEVSESCQTMLNVCICIWLDVCICIALRELHSYTLKGAE